MCLSVREVYIIKRICFHCTNMQKWAGPYINYVHIGLGGRAKSQIDAPCILHAKREGRPVYVGGGGGGWLGW